MGWFGNLFGGEKNGDEKELPWISLNAIGMLSEIKECSNIRPQFIFKHSTTCGISRMVLGMFSRGYPFDKNTADLYYLDLHAYRDVSNEVAAVFQVMHQSPQLLVIKNGITVYHTSHGAITETDLAQWA